ncbi:hypothetical protein DL98DRAFT_591492 [Cadophora sp. DSE1049]|nr:hypothetical protein DL98DRAFT_591492 [Cadophora sp. DSE1049]
MATDTSTTNMPSDASNTLEASNQSFDHFFTFDGGDVEITVMIQGERVKGKVASQAMVLASSVWKKFIFPPWEINSCSQLKTIDFTDDACTLLILLRLAHLQSTMVPTTLSLETLFQAAVQTEKYDCVKLVHLILDKWLLAVKDEASKDDCGKWLYICWAFDQEESFNEVALRMTKSLKVMGGVCLTSTGKPLSEPLPDKIIENIMSIRADTVQGILDLVYVEVEKYSRLNCADTILCKSGRMSCDAMVYGSLLNGLQQRGLWPAIEASQLILSINEIASMIRELKIYTPLRTGGRSGPTHFDCSTFRGWLAMEQLLRDMPTPGLGCHHHTHEKPTRFDNSRRRSPN